MLTLKCSQINHASHCSIFKVVNSHTCLFNALDFVNGLPGGFGSGVRIDFRKMYKFDLMCLYTNSQRVREHQKGE
jgi:hypothetical protein